MSNNRTVPSRAQLDDLNNELHRRGYKPIDYEDLYDVLNQVPVTIHTNSQRASLRTVAHILHVPTFTWNHWSRKNSTTETYPFKP